MNSRTQKKVLGCAALLGKLGVLSEADVKSIQSSLYNKTTSK